MLKNVIFATTCFIAGSILAFGLLITLFKGGWFVVFPEPAKQVETLSLLLAAATLIITAVGLFVAIAAALSYTVIKDAAVEAAKRAGADAARSVLEPLAARAQQAISMGQDTPDRTAALADALSGQDGDNGHAD